MMKEQKMVEVTEVLFSNRQDTPGRLLLIGEQLRGLTAILDFDFRDGGRFGSTGLQQGSQDYWLGLPVLQDGEVRYYLLATFLEAERAAPFYGCLITAGQLSSFDDNICCFIHGWREHLEKSGDFKRETHMPGQVELFVPLPGDLTSPPLQDGDGERLAEVGNRLTRHQQVGRLESGRSVVELLEKLFYFTDSEGRKALLELSWSSAPFGFPEENMGAKLHLAVALNADEQWQDCVIPSIGLEGSVESDERGEKGPKGLAGGLSRTQPGNATGSRHRLSLWKRLALGSAAFVILGSVWLAVTLLRGEDRWSKLLQPAYYQHHDYVQSNRVILNALDLLSEDGQGRSAEAIRKLIGGKIKYTAGLYEDVLQTDPEAFAQPGVTDWIATLDRLYDNRELWLAQQGAVGSLRMKEEELLGLKEQFFKELKGRVKDFIDSAEEPVAEDLEKLARATAFTGRYLRLKDLHTSAVQKTAWFELVLDLRALQEKEPSYTLYSRQHELLDRYVKSAPPAYVGRAEVANGDLLSSWVAYQRKQARTCYGDMLDGGGRAGLDKFDHELQLLKNIPGAALTELDRRVMRNWRRLRDGRDLEISLTDIHYEKALWDRYDLLREEWSRELKRFQEVPENTAAELNDFKGKTLWEKTADLWAKPLMWPKWTLPQSAQGQAPQEKQQADIKVEAGIELCTQPRATAQTAGSDCVRTTQKGGQQYYSGYLKTRFSVDSATEFSIAVTSKAPLAKKQQVAVAILPAESMLACVLGEVTDVTLLFQYGGQSYAKATYLCPSHEKLGLAPW